GLFDSEMKFFKYSEFNVYKIIRHGGYATVYSATFQNQKYALNCLNSRPTINEKDFSRMLRE
ncbi:28572_t:CDS:1, partial [Gigaspora margarita]